MPRRKTSRVVLGARRRGLIAKMKRELGYSELGVRYTLDHWHEVEESRTGLTPDDPAYWDVLLDYVRRLADYEHSRLGPRWLREKADD